MRRFMLLWSDGKRQELFQIVLIRLVIILAVILSSTSRMSVSCAFAEDGDYIKFLPKETEIDWSTDACEKVCTADPITKKTVIPHCKIKHDSPYDYSPFSTYLMDTGKNLIYIRDFFASTLLNLGNGYGLILYSDSEVLHMLLLFDKDGRFVGKHFITDDEILTNKEGTGLYCKGLLMWYGPFERPQRDTCALDLLKSIEEIPEVFFPLHRGFPGTISVITLPQSITGLAHPPSRDDAVAKLIDEEISRVLTWIKNQDPDILGSASFGKSLFVFLADNSSNNKMLNSLVYKYKNYLGKEILARYASTQSCKQKPIQ